MEKHALNKLLEIYGKSADSGNNLPCVKLIGTFKDNESLYFLTELLEAKNEVWRSCRAFGLLSNNETRKTFR